LNVYTRTTYGGSVNKIWSKDFEIGDFWTRADLKLTLNEPFQIVLEAVVGDGYAGDIAIDDTSFTPGCVLANVDLITVTTPDPVVTTPNPCEANGQFMCLENNECINQTLVCDFKIDCPIPGGSDEANCGICTFDNDDSTLCGWKDHSYSEVEWKRTQGAIKYGPSGDHTTGNGFYIAVESSDSYNFASIRSPTVGPSGIACQLRFWYYMDFDADTDYSHISAYYRTLESGFDSFSFLNDFTESTGPMWKQGSINIESRNERFSIGMYRT
jgi:hypothetical protein